MSGYYDIISLDVYILKYYFIIESKWTIRNSIEYISS
jgi:hypothetical protein